MYFYVGLKYCYLLKKKPGAKQAATPYSLPHPQPLATNNVFYVSMDLPIMDILYK